MPVSLVIIFYEDVVRLACCVSRSDCRLNDVGELVGRSQICVVLCDIAAGHLQLVLTEAQTNQIVVSQLGKVLDGPWVSAFRRSPPRAASVQFVWCINTLKHLTTKLISFLLIRNQWRHEDIANGCGNFQMLFENRYLIIRDSPLQQFEAFQPGIHSLNDPSAKFEYCVLATQQSETQ